MSKNPTPLERVREYEREQALKLSADERPLFHLTPLVGWMNDPNGFCYYKGQYHLFYQYHPFSRQWGPMHWGHAVSGDLLHWTYMPCALAPDTAADAGGCFSGSAVEMPDGRLMLCYTGVQPAGTFRRETQAQCIAIGDGKDFEKSLLNPVIRHAHLPEGYSEFDFRDPKVWRENNVYRMAVANRHEEKQGAILLMESGDGLDWHFVGEIDASHKEYGRMWECPDFFPLDGTQALLVSPQEMHAREEFHAGFGTVCILGDWNEKDCRFERKHIQPVDHGLNFYAPQTVLTPDGRRIMIGWMDNWETCKEAPRRHPWYAQMSTPRELRIENGRLMQRPVREIKTLWQDTILHDSVMVKEETILPGVQGRLMDMTVNLLPSTGSACRRFILHMAKDASHYVEIRCDLARGELVFDRSHGGSHRDIAHTRHVKAEARDGKLTLRLLLDKESVELFINDGERVVTSLIPTPLKAEEITFAADAPLLLSVEAHHLKA